MSYKVLNLYAGIGGNRKLWTDCEVTAIELNPEIAAIYQDFFPNDKVIIGDAHQYLLDHFKEFDFIWSSPPCQSHSDIRRMYVSIGQNKAIFPDMNLWQEIIFLKHNYSGKWVVENVKPYYTPFVQPTIQLDRHLVWCNFQIYKTKFKKDNTIKSIKSSTKHYGFNISGYKLNHRKDQILRNCVNPELGKYIFNRARNIQIEENIPQGKLNFNL